MGKTKMTANMKGKLDKIHTFKSSEVNNVKKNRLIFKETFKNEQEFVKN